MAVTFGTQPCCLACFQKLAKSGGFERADRHSQPSDLNLLMTLE